MRGAVKHALAVDCIGGLDETRPEHLGRLVDQRDVGVEVAGEWDPAPNQDRDGRDRDVIDQASVQELPG